MFRWDWMKLFQACLSWLVGFSDPNVWRLYTKAWGFFVYVNLDADSSIGCRFSTDHFVKCIKIPNLGIERKWNQPHCYYCCCNHVTAWYSLEVFVAFLLVAVVGPFTLKRRHGQTWGGGGREHGRAYHCFFLSLTTLQIAQSFKPTSNCYNRAQVLKCVIIAPYRT